jgi:hypothetical protein
LQHSRAGGSALWQNGRIPTSGHCGEFRTVVEESRT